MINILQVTGAKLQLLFAFIILSIITITAIVLIMLNKNSRSQKVQTVANNHHWQYQEFVNFNDDIKSANFGILNYSQNAIFRHVISSDNYNDLGFNFFDCRAIEPFGVHNSSVILFNLSIDSSFSNLHFCITPIENISPVVKENSTLNQSHLSRIRNMQRLKEFKSYPPFKKHTLHSNNLNLLEQFLQTPTLNSSESNNAILLNTWLLAHPHLHIEVSNGILLAYQPDQILTDNVILPAIDAVADLSKGLRKAP